MKFINGFIGLLLLGLTIPHTAAAQLRENENKPYALVQIFYSGSQVGYLEPCG